MKLFAALLTLVASVAAQAAVVDRIAAIIDRQVITVSEITQLASIRLIPREKGQTEDEYRRAILEVLIAQALRFRDVERFGAPDVTKDAIEARLLEMQRRFASPAEFQAAIARSELTLDEVRALIKRQMQVEAYIQQRFAPLIGASNEEIAAYYRSTWSQQRRQRGLSVPPLAEVSEEIRGQLRGERLQTEIDKWTAQLRARTNVDVYTWR
jgi:peptidyl-prolyl cis-trans isomerase SurA